MYRADGVATGDACAQLPPTVAVCAAAPRPDSKTPIAANPASTALCRPHIPAPERTFGSRFAFACPPCQAGSPDVFVPRSEALEKMFFKHAEQTEAKKERNEMWVMGNKVPEILKPGEPTGRESVLKAHVCDGAYTLVHTPTSKGDSQLMSRRSEARKPRVHTLQAVKENRVTQDMQIESST